MPHKPSVTPLPRPKGACARRFNRKANACEIENKLLVPGRQFAAFFNVENFFRDRGLILSEVKGNHLLTNQYDTLNRSLESRGASARTRGTCVDGDLNHIIHPDFCVKTGKSMNEAGALERGEYEDRIAAFTKPTLAEVKTKYPAKEYPELHAALEGVEEDDLVKWFRIDCMRNRFVVELPPKMSGLNRNKRFVGELICDDVYFVLDIPGCPEPFIFARDLEIECEMLRKPCAYDTSANRLKNISSKLTKAERNLAMANMGDVIRQAAVVELIVNHDSKAERGFAAFDRLQRTLPHVVRYMNALNCGPAVTQAVVPAFNVLSGGSPIVVIANDALRERMVARPSTVIADAPTLPHAFG